MGISDGVVVGPLVPTWPSVSFPKCRCFWSLMISCNKFDALVSLIRSLSDVDESLIGNDYWVVSFSFTSITV